MISCSPRSNRSALTLVEILVVITVLVVIAAIAIPRFRALSAQSGKSALTNTDLTLVRTAVASFRTDTGYYPLKLSDLTVASSEALSTPNTGIDSAGVRQPISAANFHGPYLQSVPSDPVSGNALNYSTANGTVGEVTSDSTGN